MKKYLLSLIAMSSLIVPTIAQDIHFSQYNLTPMVINPAQAGAYKNFEFIADYKTQWTSISPNAYKTMMFSYDGRFLQKKWKENMWLAAGANIFSDKAGDGRMGTTQFTGSVGVHKRIGAKSVLGGSIFGAYAQRSVDYKNLTFDEQYVGGSYNAANPINEPGFTITDQGKFNLIDVGIGTLYQYNKGEMYSTANDMFIVHAGVALFHLNQPKYSFLPTVDKLFMKMVGHAEVLVGIKNTNIALMPVMIYMQQGPSQEIYPGCYFRYMLREQSKFTGFVKGAAISVGTHFRASTMNKDAFIPSVQLEVAEYTIGLSYDMNISDLTTATSGKGGFEIHLRYGNPNPFLYKSAASFQ